MRQKDEKEMMTITDVMEYLQISRSTVYRLIKRKAFPVYKVLGRGLRLKRSDIERYIEEQKDEG